MALLPVSHLIGELSALCELFEQMEAVELARLKERAQKEREHFLGRDEDLAYHYSRLRLLAHLAHRSITVMGKAESEGYHRRFKAVFADLTEHLAKLAKGEAS